MYNTDTVQNSTSNDKELRRKMLDKERKQRKRLNDRPLNAGVGNDVIREILERTIDSCQLTTLISTFPKPLRCAVQNWCVGSVEQQNAPIASNDPKSTMNEKRKLLDKERKQKSRMKTGLVKAGIDDSLICQVLDKTIEAHQLTNLISNDYQKTLASNVTTVVLQCW